MSKFEKKNKEHGPLDNAFSQYNKKRTIFIKNKIPTSHSLIEQIFLVFSFSLVLK